MQFLYVDALEVLPMTKEKELPSASDIFVRETLNEEIEEQLELYRRLLK